ncbi:MAG: crotonase/enoyl-CoA hydratase family protein [Micromonosporaceae bacterium]|nr:crotonase/enoyl-CoA hydratase family protein [Micromonosporaceae bacterium]
MDPLVSYDLADGVATLTMDDGKVNAMSPAMVAAVNAALDRAEADGAIVVLAGRPGVFCAGFDLKTLAAQDDAADRLALDGFALVSRLVAFPTPVVAACSGHAIALGALLLAACDYRLGAVGDYKLAMNETAIGIPLPVPAIELLRQRLHPSVLHRAVNLAETFSPADAVAAGWLDRVVDADDLLTAAREHARGLTSLNLAAYRLTKQRAWQSTVDSFDKYFAQGARTRGILRPLSG